MSSPISLVVQATNVLSEVGVLFPPAVLLLLSYNLSMSIFTPMPTVPLMPIKLPSVTFSDKALNFVQDALKEEKILAKVTVVDLLSVSKMASRFNMV